MEKAPSLGKNVGGCEVSESEYGQCCFQVFHNPGFSINI